MQEVGTNDEASSNLWIVAFCISLVINILFISAFLISRRYGTKDIFCNFQRQTLIVVNILILKVDFVIRRPVLISIGNRNPQQIWLLYPD